MIGPTTAATPRHALTTNQAMPKNTERNTSPIRWPTKAKGRCQAEVGCQRGCGASSGNANGGRPLSELSIGIRVIATTSEIAMAIATVSA